MISYTHHRHMDALAIALHMGTTQSTVWRVLHDNQLHPYHPQKVQGLCEEDFRRRVQFCQWILQRCLNEPHFLSTDEALFTRDGFFNCRNSHVWAEQNPHATVARNHQERFAVNVWAGIIGDNLIGSYLLPPRLNGHIYRIFLEETVPELLQDVPLIVRQQMWMQQDGAPHTLLSTCGNF
jgi:hypothetical protein